MEVLQHLDDALRDAHSGNLMRGIRHGVSIGTVMWIVMLGAYFYFSGAS